MIAASGFVAALECTKFDFGRGSAPDPTRGAYSWFKRATSKEDGRGGEERWEKGEEGGEGGTGPPYAIPGSVPGVVHCAS